MCYLIHFVCIRCGSPNANGMATSRSILSAAYYLPQQDGQIKRKLWRLHRKYSRKASYRTPCYAVAFGPTKAVSVSIQHCHFKESAYILSMNIILSQSILFKIETHQIHIFYELIYVSPRLCMKKKKLEVNSKWNA